MKILIPFFSINNSGGIGGHTEYLIRGFKSLGHEATICMLEKNKRKTAVRKKTHAELVEKKYQPSILEGEYYHSSFGFTFYGVRHHYNTPEGLAKWQEYCATFDVVLWTTFPIPKNQQTKGWSTWQDVFNLNTKQFAIVHDGNTLSYKTWTYHFRDIMDGFVCVHYCSLMTMKNFAKPRALIFNPQDIENNNLTLDEKLDNFQKKEDTIFAVQIYKGWKHVEDLVRAFPYFHDKVNLHLAGGGLQYAYLQSPEKCPPKFFRSTKWDPDCPPEHDTDLEGDYIKNGTRIWDHSMELGMRDSHYVSTLERDEFFGKYKFFVDPSWSKGFLTGGGHFNRTIVEAIMKGVIPMATNWGMLGSKDHTGYGVFKPEKNYLVIDPTLTPKQYGEQLIDNANRSVNEYANMIEENEKLLKFFDYRRVAQQYVNFFQGNFEGLTVATKSEPFDTKYIEKANNIMKNHFGIDMSPNWEDLEDSGLDDKFTL